jgi:hypothetical protein
MFIAPTATLVLIYRTSTVSFVDRYRSGYFRQSLELSVIGFESCVRVKFACKREPTFRWYRRRLELVVVVVVG